MQDDALGSFVGGLVKSDVARFGNFDLSLQLPWETDFAKSLLDPDCVWDPLNGFKQDSQIPPLSTLTLANPSSKQPAKECHTGAIFAWAVSLGAAARDPAAERERKFDQGVCMWSRLVLRYSACCTLYDCVLDGQGAGENTYALIEAAVSAAVGVKSPHTIHKRASSFWAFVRWVDVHDPQSAEKLHEVQVWNFVQFLKASEAPASKASSVISSFRFAHFVLGFKVTSIIESKRICGAAEQQLVKVRKLRLYARARPSDFLFIETVEVDCPADSDYPLLVFEALSAFKDAGRALPAVRGPLTLVGRALRAFLGEPEEIIAIYSRELAAAPVRKLQDLIREIVAGRFMPDSSRSSYFPKTPSAKEAGKAIACSDSSAPGTGAVKIEVLSSDESGSEPGDSPDSESSGSTSSSSSSSVEANAQPIVRRWKRAKVESTDQVWYAHTGSGVLHLLASPEEAPMLLACGRPVNKNYREATREEVGLSRDTLRAFAAHGIDTLSKLAYSCGQPGAPLPQSDFDDFIATVIPAALLGEKGSVKRLIFESQALLLTDLREQVTQPDKWATKNVPTVERQKRMEAVKASIPGVLVEGSLEPSHGLLNAACRMEREGQLRYIAPEQCGTRMYEIQNVKAQSKVLSLEEGKLAISEEKDLPEVTCGSALLLQEALKRRGIALQFAGVASFLAHEKYVLKLFGHMGREPPPGHARTSVHQLLTADRQVWTKLIEDEVSPRRSPAGTYPVDDALLPALQSYDVTVALLPRESSKDGKKRFAPTKKHQNEREQKVGKGDGGKGSGKGKGKRPTWQPSVPEAIRKLGGSAQTPDKKRICFSRNLPCGCTLDPCPKGLHVCALCFSPDHGIQDHTADVHMVADDGEGIAATIAATSTGGQDYPLHDCSLVAPTGSKLVVSEHPAEKFSAKCEPPVLADILNLITLLESEKPSRGQSSENTFSWTSGAYAKGPLRGLRKHASVFPACMRMLCRLVLQAFPEADFGAVAVFKNLRTPLHVDINNSPGSVNYLIPVSSFTGGEVWQEGQGSVVVHDELGHPLMGSLLPVADGPCVVDPRRTHCTMPWVGERVLLVAFKPAHTRDLSIAFKQQLQSLGFPSRALGLCALEANLLPPSPPLPEASLLPMRPVLPNSDVVWNDPLVIELFAGNGRVTACLKQLGLSAAGVDRNPSKSVSFCLPADLTSARGQKLCKEWLASPRLAGLFATPPAFTAANADAITFLLHVLSTALTNGVLCAIANPRQSRFWQNPQWRAVASSFRFVACQECTFGGRHDDHTVFAVSDSGFDKLARSCPGPPCKALNRCPDPGTGCPAHLAMQVACCFAEVFVKKGWQPPSQCFDAFDPRLQVPMSRALAGAQPPASKIPPLVPEHKRVVVLRHPPGLQLSCQPMQRLTTDWLVPQGCHAPCACIPAKSQLLRHVPIGQSGGDETVKVGLWEMAWGIPWDPEEFMKTANESSHPRTIGSVLPQPLKDSLDALDEKNDAEVTELRARVIKDWVHLSVSLAQDEAKLKASMHPDVRAITEPKRILLWESLMAKYAYPDPGVSSLLKEGIPLVGHAPISGVFKPKFKPMQATPEQVREDFHDFRKKVHKSLKPQEHSLMSEVFEKTEKELEAAQELCGFQEIKSFVQKVLEDGRLPHHEALRLRGRCQFADSQIFGRTGKKCLGLITAHAYGLEEAISHELRVSLERFLQRLECDAPRLIKILEGGFWKVYTDASYEPGATTSYCGIGGVLVDPSGVPRKFFSAVLDDSQKIFLGESKSAQIIFQAELLALTIAMDAWSHDFKGCPVIFFVDNNGVRDITISGHAKASIARRLLEIFLQLEHDASVVPWYARVPSPSNPADEPSRIECKSLCLLGTHLERSTVGGIITACLKKVQGLR
ncbi:unnamed protein product [Symbiodinium sp. CCMP2592]|nr:unnamed protein product [Symbiodinium sp. CCMP2592]